MKKTYKKLEMEVISFDKKDVITASAAEVNDNGFAVYSLFGSYEDFFRS